MPLWLKHLIREIFGYGWITECEEQEKRRIAAIKPEPVYPPGRTPPPHWNARCHNCAARNEMIGRACWWCGWGGPPPPVAPYIEPNPPPMYDPRNIPMR